LKIVIKKDDCIGCKKCIVHCPYSAIEFDAETGKVFIKEELCTTCGACIESCSVNAIDEIGVKDRKEKDFLEYKDIWVVAEFQEDRIKNVSLELISTARELADKKGCKVYVVAMGLGIKNTVSHLGGYGADGVYIVENEDLRLYQTLTYAEVLVELFNRYKPEIVLFGATHQGRDLAPRVANKIQTGLTADCTMLEIEEETGLLMQTRPAFGGNIMATILCPDHRPQMATVRPGVMKVCEIGKAKELEIKEIDDIDVSPYKDIVRILESVKEIKHTINLEDAEVILAGGRGMGTKDNFEKLYKLADKLGAEVAASRAVIEDGWCPLERQVGQTGKTVRPELYLALGISGAVQHLAGMENSKYIIAINRDVSAPIFNVSDLGIVGDVNKILPLLEEELPKLMEKGSEI